MTQRLYAGGAVKCTLNSTLTSADNQSFSITAVSGSLDSTWPNGVLKFLIVIDRGLSSEEKMLVTRTLGSSTLTVATGDRGKDNTTAQSHSGGAFVEHCLGAIDVSEPNTHINVTTGDDHTQYLKTDGTRALTGVTTIAAAPGNSAIGDVAAKGTGPTIALSDHKHGREGVQWIGHTFTVSGEVFVPSGDVDFIVPLFVPVASGRTVKLAKCRYKINSGTSATVKLQINGSDATGFTGISVTTTAAETDPANISFADGDRLALVVTAVSAHPTNMTFTCVLEHG